MNGESEGVEGECEDVDGERVCMYAPPIATLCT